MGQYLIKRFLYLIPIMLGVSIITFALINLAPGDPAELLLRAGEMEPTREAVEALREELGLNDPIGNMGAGSGTYVVLTWVNLFVRDVL
jgi:peptide/nickel transport system permease protein